MLIRRLLMVLGALLLSVQSSFAVEPDWRDYAPVLRDYVRQGSKNGTDLAVVDYRALKKNGAVEAVYRQLAAFPVCARHGHDFMR